MILQLNPPIPVDTPKGKAQAQFLIDYGPEHDLYWVTFVDQGGECWTFGNRDVRGQNNVTLGRQPHPAAHGTTALRPVFASSAEATT